MGAFTAQILVGHEHRYGGGIIPSHAVFLSENSRPAWILKELEVAEGNSCSEFIRWIPTIDNMLDDAMLLIGIHVVKDEVVIKAARNVCKFDSLNELELYEAFTSEDLTSLYDLVRASSVEYRIALTVFNVSHIFDQCRVLDLYQCRANIFTTTHSNY